MTARLANLGGRAVLVREDQAFDLERSSAERFGADPMQALARWDELCDWIAGRTLAGGEPVDETRLEACVPRPQKIFGIGLNYRDHAEEADLPLPKQPLVFTKFPSCLAGPSAPIELHSNRVDWEVELVVVIGRRCRGVSAERAREVVAGYTAGQDVSDRRAQFAGKPPQFSMGKSYDGYGPIGPALVALDAFADPDDLALSCDINGENVQDGRTRDMIFSVSELVAFLSQHVTLEPGDLVFTGTPAGVGSVRKPPRYLEAGDLVESRIEGIGRLSNRCVQG